MPSTSKRVLVAEDNLGLAHVLQFNLERSGFDVAVAHDGEEAWKFIQREKFDIVITDQEMPLMTGLELCARLRELPDYKTTPVVMVTARELELDFRAVLCRRSVRKRGSGLPNGGGLSAVAAQGLAQGRLFRGPVRSQNSSTAATTLLLARCSGDEALRRVAIR